MNVKIFLWKQKHNITLACSIKWLKVTSSSSKKKKNIIFSSQMSHHFMLLLDKHQ